MGSCETDYWHKKWKPIKVALCLTAEQKSLITGSLLGDGTMRIGKGCVHANFKVEQCLKQEAFVRWKYGILQPFVYTEPKLRFSRTSSGERYEKSWWFRTIRHPLLTEIYHEFYEGDGYRAGRKYIRHDIAKYLDPLSLAVWIMDDGSYNNGTIDISTYSFLQGEIETLARAIEERFAVTMRWYGDRDKGYRMYASKPETQKIIRIIAPHIIPSVLYKVGFITP